MRDGRQGNSTAPEVYQLPLYHAVDPWVSTPDGFAATKYIVTVYAMPKGRARTDLEVDLIQVRTIHGDDITAPRDKAGRVYMLEAITRALTEQTGKTIRPIAWGIVDC